MKKPKITSGEWVVSDFRPQVGVLKYNGLAIKVVCEFDKEMDWMDDPDMKAISAVPEMIDALLEANDYIIETAPDDIYPERLLNKLEKALKKAGAKL